MPDEVIQDKARTRVMRAVQIAAQPSSLPRTRHLLPSRLQVVEPLSVESSHWLGEVPVHLAIVQLQLGGGVVRHHPGKHGVLGQVVERSVSWKYFSTQCS